MKDKVSKLFRFDLLDDILYIIGMGLVSGGVFIEFGVGFMLMCSGFMVLVIPITSAVKG